VPVTVALDHIGPYRVLRSFASGGTAEVFEVQDPSSGERFALKYLVAVDSSLKRFNREYEAMARLNHPSIVRVYHYGVHEGHPWLTMEMLRGVPAQSHIKRVGAPGDPNRTAEVLRVGTLLSRALAYIHARGLVHRDLKSANVLVLPDRRIKLLDFGAARLADAAEKITLDGEFVGTFAYASPEQLQAKPFDARSDLYSLGVLLYRLATGQRPFGAKEPARLAYQVIHQPPPNPRSLIPNLPQPLASLLLHLLEKEPGDRPQSAEVVAAALEHLAGRPIGTRQRVAVHTRSAAPRVREQRRVWQRLGEGHPGDLLIIGGDDGSDRTAFLGLVSETAAERGWDSVTHRTGGLEGLIALLHDLGTGIQDSRIAQTLTAMDRLSTREALARPRDRVALRRVAAEVVKLRARQSERPFLIVLPELHDLGGPGLELLGGVRRALQADRVKVALLGSCRSPRLDIDSLVDQHLPRPWKIEVPPLQQRDVAVAVGTMLGHRPPPAPVARELLALTGGQPKYLQRVVEALVESGLLEAEDDRLEWGRLSLQLPAPELAVEIAETHWATLGAYHRRVLEAMSLLSDASDAAVVAAALGFRSDELQPILADLVAAGVLRREGEMLHWRLPLMLRVVREGLSPLRRRVMERALAYELDTRGPSPEQVRLLVATGRRGRALNAAAQVIDDLVRSQQLQEALDVIEPLIAGDNDKVVSRALGAVYLQHATVLQTVKPTDPRAARSLGRARKLIGGDPQLEARAELGQARLFAGIGHYRNFRRHLSTAWRHAQDTPNAALRAEVAFELGRSHRWHGDLTLAEGWFDAAVAAAHESDDPTVAGRASLGAIGCLTARGRLDEAETWVSQLMSDLQWSADKAAYWMALAAWGDILRLQGRYSEAISLVDQRLPDASQSQERGAFLALLLSAARIEMDLARIGRAQERMDEVAATLEKGEHLHIRLDAELLTGRISLESGRLGEAAWRLQDVHTRAKRAELVVIAERARVYLAETLHAQGDLEGSEQQWRNALLGMLGTGELSVVTSAAISRARSTCEMVDPRTVFRPVAKLLDAQAFLPARIEWLLARAAWHKVKGNPGDRNAAQEAADAIALLRGALADTERAALRVHPWSRRLRAVLP
jgi:tetratricopeptide (TPR) repeat protein